MITVNEPLADARDMVAPAFEAARAAWTSARRAGAPRLVAIAYFALGDTEQGRANVWDYYSISGDEIARLITDGVAGGPAQVKDTVAAFADIGADELILNPTVGNRKRSPASLTSCSDRPSSVPVPVGVPDAGPAGCIAPCRPRR